MGTKIYSKKSRQTGEHVHTCMFCGQSGTDLGNNQHSTLITQRERLIDVLREMLNRFYPHTCDRGPVCAKCKALLAANEVLTTIEQEGTQR